MGSQKSETLVTDMQNSTTSPNNTKTGPRPVTLLAQKGKSVHILSLRHSLPFHCFLLRRGDSSGHTKTGHNGRLRYWLRAEKASRYSPPIIASTSAFSISPSVFIANTTGVPVGPYPSMKGVQPFRNGSCCVLLVLTVSYGQTGSYGPEVG